MLMAVAASLTIIRRFHVRPWPDTDSTQSADPLHLTSMKLMCVSALKSAISNWFAYFSFVSKESSLRFEQQAENFGSRWSRRSA